MTIDTHSNPGKKFLWIYDVILIGVLLIGAYFRFSGIDWGDGQNQHPDELFLTSVTYDIQPVHSIAQYFNTATSTLNPHNVGHSFYVYGTLPIFIVRGLAELTHQMGNLQLFGRQLSALADLASVALLYFIVKRLYGPRVGILAAAFSALAVMEIQQSHFYTTDNFATFFMFLAILFAVEIMLGKNGAPQSEAGQDAPKRHSFFTSRLLWLSVAFGLALGMAVASKLNAAPLAIVLPGALAVRYFGRKGKGQELDVPATSMPRSSFEGFFNETFVFMVVGAVFAILTFRLLQPYAFSGLGLNPKWLANLQELRDQSSPNTGIVWALQWARRTHLYSFENLTHWGLGLPLGILAWAGFLWMGWRILKGNWRQHVLLWSWTAIYFVWQSLAYNPNMRYQLPIYPLLAMIAAWAVFDWARPHSDKVKWLNGRKILAAAVGAVILALTFCWAYAFHNIYLKPETRVAASRWIFQNVPGPINLQIHRSAGTTYQQPLPFQSGAFIQADTPYQTTFTAQADGVLDKVLLPHVTNHFLRVTIAQDPTAPQPLASGFLLVSPSNGTSQILQLNQQPNLSSQQNYLISVEALDPELQLDLCGPLQLSIAGATSPVEQEVEPASHCVLNAGQPYQLPFTPQADGSLMLMSFSRVMDVSPVGSQTIKMALSSTQGSSTGQVLASASVTADFTPNADVRGNPVELVPSQPITLQRGVTYQLRLDSSGTALTLNGAAIANETDYDWNLPFRVDGYDGFNGIYRGDLNLQVYWNENANKLARYESFLGQTDYIFIPTAHQYMQTTRIPEMYPLTTVYYRQLLGCPADKDILWCYRVAKPGMFKGNLGFDLVAVFESYPTIGPLAINDQNSEESFTFYDHPKVLIFRKNPDYSAAKVQAILGAVDLSNVIQLTPGQADHYKSLMLPANQLAVQQAGGTWSDLFNTNAIYNRYPGLGLVLWYLVILLLGWFVYPLARAALPGLADRGYPLARILGLLLWAWLAWMAGSIGLTYSRTIITIALGLILLLGIWLGWRQRQELKQELQERWKYFLMVEILFLGFFLVDLLIRIGNPDIWHDPNGGERPMEFAYFNAILKSTTFPPYDPWFGGGYINYYYYGYVIMGTPVKFLGIVPAIAWNFILPTLYACLAVGAFSILWNLFAGKQPDGKITWKSLLGQKAFLAGLAGAAAMVLIGNLGVVRLFYRSFMCTAAPSIQLGEQSIHDCIITPGSPIDKVNVFTRLWWTLKGFFQALAGHSLDYTVTNARELYWGATRTMPSDSGGAITEFPLASFLWSDLHAHLMGLGETVLAIAWVLSVVQARARWKDALDCAAAFFVGGLVIGSLKPINTWDFYSYLLLAGLVLAVVIWKYFDPGRLQIDLPAWIKRLGVVLGGVILLAALSMILYIPYTKAYGQFYSSFDLWRDNRNDISSYLVHWGVFLFFIVSWMVWETRQWMAATPASSLRKLKPYRELILSGVFLLLVVLVVQQVWTGGTTPGRPSSGPTVLWLALPLAAWAGVLMLRPGQADIRRLVLFMVGTGLVITAFVEIFIVKGDVGRQNTVFKFYMQAWVLLGLSATAGSLWLLEDIKQWLPNWRTAWGAVAYVLVLLSVFFLLIYGPAKVRDRLSETAPHGLDGMIYMASTKLDEFGSTLDLSEDYRLIRWMQQNIQGSPVIAEAPSSGIQYSWLNRISVYTGLPDVIGWEWHQIQERVIFTDTIKARGVEEDMFYSTTDADAAQKFLEKYNVRYIVVGQLEHAKYGAEGLAKFPAYNGKLWKEVYHDGQTALYEVSGEAVSP